MGRDSIDTRRRRQPDPASAAAWWRSEVERLARPEALAILRRLVDRVWAECSLLTNSPTQLRNARILLDGFLRPAECGYADLCETAERLGWMSVVLPARIARATRRRPPVLRVEPEQFG